MPRHDPIPPNLQRSALAWARYKKLMSWMALAAVAAVLITMLYVQDVLGDPVKTPSEKEK